MRMLKDLKTLVKFISSGSLYRVVFNRPCVAGAVLQTPLFFTGAPLNFKVQIHLQSLALKRNSKTAYMRSCTYKMQGGSSKYGCFLEIKRKPCVKKLKNVKRPYFSVFKAKGLHFSSLKATYGPQLVPIASKGHKNTITRFFF